MTTETEQALAVLFRRFNDEAVLRDDLVKAMSLELDWTKPSLAENLIDRGLNAGYVERVDEDRLAAGFDPSEIEIPFGFDPADELFEPVETAEDTGTTTGEGDEAEGLEEETPLLGSLLDRIADAVEGDRNQAVAAANAKQEAMGGLVTIEAAALLVAHEHGLDVGDEADEVLAALSRVHA